MASTKKIAATYSPKLDLMAAHIKDFLQSNHNQQTTARAHKGIADFCYNNSDQFTASFLRQVGVDELSWDNLGAIPGEELLRSFYEQLAKLDGECVFLLKDTQHALEKYQAITDKGFGILVNRSFLQRDGGEDDYFTLVSLVYQSVKESRDVATLLDAYFAHFDRLTKNDRHFASKAKEVAEYVRAHTKSNAVVFVDLGFQFTFSLFCQAAIKKYSGNISADFYSLTAYPWLQKLFDGKYFSPRNEFALDAELQAIERYRKIISDRSVGALLGFAIGDALGFPAAGINATDIPKFLPNGITGFSDNSKHPYFSHLKAGQYTDNTSMLVLSAEHLVESGGFDVQKYADKLSRWYKQLQGNPLRERWLGPTATNALKKLVAIGDVGSSGSKTTQSCSAIYRVVPFSIYYRPFRRALREKLVLVTESSTAITHNSVISKTGAIISALIIGDLVNGVLPLTAVEAACKVVGRTNENGLLLDKIDDAMDNYKSNSIEWARKHFGTGSPVYQMLPLAIFIFLQYPEDFEKAVLEAANSYRDDTPEEQARMEKLTWEQQLLEAKGGNTDGIAGLVGAFVGAHIGIGSIPQELREVENADEIIKLGEKLI
ncbi:MAG: hypothetical protein COT71_02180 [Candidatus Andersenbacteria bacterium CG10_big_fil_rev_8_21_14_0_10_54_11]|uniref:ADP-ribosylglycohydrolase n=1 Tax=Candidatus Andersenbacteria bacterium CG10_big_fil_rev_8_21_14_0_10_54_11 TaxID=1974485 RepID=A0A2M6WZD8_9BACT|nr:MAG: hypothetical protein COT71_02180 [Candidatus Andersenbacteria bacterium CG10_big_fil_rev_8_21_14_0_10_54_11]